jgi:predicted dehydrogenase/nucleoside-diphosphate-sugar epimerase
VKKTLSVAVVGTGGMGRHHATVACRLTDRARLAAVCDADEARAREIADRVEGCVAYTNVETMLAEVRPDVVHVCTPPASHAPIARVALEAGAHIYVEKPFAESVDDARKLLHLAADRSLKVCAGHQVLFERPARIARELLPRIGEVRHVDSFFAFRPAPRKDGRPQRTPSEQLLDILPHPTYLLLEFMGGASKGSELSLDGLRVDETGALHAILSSGDAAGTLVATLEGRPVDSFLRIVGTRGTLMLDFVRGIVVPSFGTGTTIEKILDPYGRAMSLVFGSTGSLGRRFFGRQWSYPGLAELIGAFYDHIAGTGSAPLSPESIERTVEICERARTALDTQAAAAPPPEAVMTDPEVAITGGTGLLGRAVARALVDRGVTPLALARRLPLKQDREPGVKYAVCDLAERESIDLPPSIRVVVHCAAEVAGGFEAHQRNSIDTTQNLLDAMRDAGIPRLVHISSLAVIAADAAQPISEESPLEQDGRARGPYVWGKLESEKIAAAAPETHGVDVRIIRPGPLVDAEAFAPPGKLGRGITAGLFVAVGNPRATIPLSDVSRVGEIAAWTALTFGEAPRVLNALDPKPACRKDLVRRLKEARPGTRVVWLYRPVLAAMAVPLLGIQKMLRPGKPAIDLRTVFDSPRCNTRLARETAERVRVGTAAVG